MVGLRAVRAVVLVAETHVPVVHVEQPVVGDGDPVGVAADVVQHLLRSGEGRLRVHDPLRASCGHEVPGKGRSVAKGFE